jgi:hypothetical protein
MAGTHSSIIEIPPQDIEQWVTGMLVDPIDLDLLEVMIERL